MNAIKSYTAHIDWLLFLATLPLLAAGLLTMNTFTGENYFFERQLIWIAIALGVFFISSHIDWRFLKRTDVLVSFFAFSIMTLLAIFLFGELAKGAQNRFQFGSVALQPADPVKLLVILLLAKYFSRRHIEIAHIRHILVSGMYALAPFVLVFLQPDFGSAIIIFAVWLGMVIVSGVSKKHLAFVFVTGAVSFFLLWSFAFADYQKQRIMTFLNPLTDLQGAGYNAYQSTIAVGAGGLVGRGVGYGTQSRLEFLPEYETDFIFAAFAEEWGFIGALMLLGLFGVVVWRILALSQHGASNFEILFGAGLVIMLMSHLIIHVGMNVGLLPVTGITLPFVSYGGSHLVAEFLGLGMLTGMRRYGRVVRREDTANEMVGITGGR